MRRRLALVLCGVLHASCALGQPQEPFRIGALFPAFVRTYETDLETITQLDSMSFNYWYLGLSDPPTAPQRPQFEAEAARRGIPLRTPTLRPIIQGDILTSMDRLTTGWDFRIEAEDAGVATLVHGQQTFDGLATPAGGPNAVVSSGTPGIVVREKYPSDLLWASHTDPRRPHTAAVRYRLRWDGTAPPGTPVATISAALRPRQANPAPGNPATRTLTAGDFSGCSSPCYLDFTLQLDQDNSAVEGGNRWAGDYFRYSVEHLGRGTLYVDHIHVDTETARRVLAGEFDEALVAYLTVNEFDTPLYDGFSVKDEPQAFNMTSIGHLSDAVDAALGRRANTVVVGSQQEDFFAYYLETVRPPKLVTDPYRLGAIAYAPDTCSPYGPRGILANPDFPPDQLWGVKPYDPAEYHQDLQVQLDCLAADIQRAATVAERFDVPYWYVAQAHGIFGQDSPSAPWTWRGLRQVSEAEARLVAYLGVAYGAKAVIYHLYKTVEAGGNDVNVGMVTTGLRVTPPAAIEPANSHSSNYDRDLLPDRTPVYTGYRRIWEAFRRANAELTAAGPTLMRLRRVVTYNSSDGHPEASPIARMVEEGSGVPAAWVEVGVLDDPGDAAHYLVLVNRMARPTDDRTLTITLRGPHGNKRVTDVVTGETVARLRAGVSSFDLEMIPGDGRVLRIGSGS